MIRFIRLMPAPLLIGSIFLGSCDTLRHEVTPDQLTDESAKLVVTCFLSPQDLVLAAKITRTKTVLGGQAGSSGDNNVTNAVVKLSGGGRSATLQYDAKAGVYRADIRLLPLVAGRTYTLVARTPNGKPLTSTCTIPAPVKLTGTTFDSLTEEQAGRPYRRYFIRARWQDPAGQRNFYQVTGLFRSVVNCPACEKKPTYQAKEEVNSLKFDGDAGSLQGDGDAPGRVITSEPGFMSGVYVDEVQQPSFRNQYKTALLILNLLNTDQAYYAYQNGIVRQAQVAGNPFAEPVPLPSNINGGLGCFAGYNRSTVAVKLK